MAKAGVHGHGRFGLTNHPRHFRQREFWQYGGLTVFGNAFGPGSLLVIAPRQHHVQARLVNFAGQFTPVVFRPVLGWPGGAVDKHHVGRIGYLFLGKLIFIEQKLTVAFRQWVAQRLGKQLAHPFNRVLLPGHHLGVSIKAAGQRFPGRVPVESEAWTLSHFS